VYKAAASWQGGGGIGKTAPLNFNLSENLSKIQFGAKDPPFGEILGQVWHFEHLSSLLEICSCLPESCNFLLYSILTYDAGGIIICSVNSNKMICTVWDNVMCMQLGLSVVNTQDYTNHLHFTNKGNNTRIRYRIFSSYYILAPLRACCLIIPSTYLMCGTAI